MVQEQWTRSFCQAHAAHCDLELIWKAASAAFFMSASRLNLLGLVAFSASWLAYDHYRPWVNFHAEALAVAGCLGMVLSLLARANAVTTMPAICRWILVTAMLPWVYYFGGPGHFAGDALICSMYLFALAAAVWIGSTLAQQNNRADSPGRSGKTGFFGISGSAGLAGLMHSLWIAAMTSAAIGLVQWFQLSGPLGMYVVQSDLGDRAMGNLGQANQLATLLLMGTAAFGWVYERGTVGRLAFGLGIVLLTLVLVMTQSRAGMISVFLIAGFMIWKQRTLRMRLTTRAVSVWAAGFAIATLTLPYLSEALMLSEVRSLGSVGPVTERIMMWKQVGFAIWQSPWVGYGWNQTPTAHAAGAVAYPSSVTYTNAHSFVMDILAWNGLPVGLLLCAIIAWWFGTRILRSATRDALFSMAAMLSFAMHSMVEYPFAYAYFLIAAGLMVGIVEANHPGAKTVSVAPKWVWPLVVVWSGIGAYVIYEYFLIEEDFRVVRFENLNIGRTPPEYDVPHIWMTSHMAVMLKASRLRAHPGMSSEEMETLRSASSRFAYGALRFRYAQALALNGDPNGAVSQMAIVRGMYGEVYYAACKAALREQSGKYPQFANLSLPG